MVLTGTLPPQELVERLQQAVLKLLDTGGALSEAALGYVDLDILNAWSRAAQAAQQYVEGVEKRE